MTYYLVQDTSDHTYVITTETLASEHWSNSMCETVNTPLRAYVDHSAQKFVRGQRGYPDYRLLYSSPNPIVLDDIPELFI